MLESCIILQLVRDSFVSATALLAWLQRLQLLRVVEEPSRRSWQRTTVIEELKDFEKSLRLYSGASHGRGGVRGGGRDRVKVCAPHALHP